MTNDDIPKYLRRWPGLYVRDGVRIIEAPLTDAVVAQTYPSWPDKGTVTHGRRLTLLTSKMNYHINEEIRIIHVVEFTTPGEVVYVMGPKPIYGEYVNNSLATEPSPEDGDPLAPTFYDGATIDSPAVDYGYDITKYRFTQSGIYQIYWKLGELQSNILKLEVKSIQAES